MRIRLEITMMMRMGMRMRVGNGDDGGGHTEDDHAVAEPGERLTNRPALQTCSDEGGE